MTKATRERWAGRIREWRESGLSPDAFAFGKDFAGSSLRAAVIELEGTGRSQPRSTSKSVTASPPRFLPVVAAGAAPPGPMSVAELVVEVGSARIRVARGADLALVGDLIRELQRGAR